MRVGSGFRLRLGLPCIVASPEHRALGPSPQALGFVDLPTLMGAEVQPDENLLGMAQVRAAPTRGCGVGARCARAHPAGSAWSPRHPALLLL